MDPVIASSTATLYLLACLDLIITRDSLTPVTRSALLAPFTPCILQLAQLIMFVHEDLHPQRARRAVDHAHLLFLLCAKLISPIYFNRLHLFFDYSSMCMFDIFFVAAFTTVLSSSSGYRRIHFQCSF